MPIVGVKHLLQVGELLDTLLYGFLCLRSIKRFLDTGGEAGFAAIAISFSHGLVCRA